MAVITIVGPTASGKTSVSVGIASNLGAVVVSADSRSIYRDMDIGTAKPDLVERAGVYHWGFDLIDPGGRFSAAEFKSGAEKIIEDQNSKGLHTVIAGGTGLYVDSVVLDYTFPSDRGLVSRPEVERMSIDELISLYNKHNVQLPKESRNIRRLQSGILRDMRGSRRRESPIDNCIVVGISTDRSVLKRRIRDRIDTMFDRGVVEETLGVMSKYGLDGEDLPGNVYSTVALYAQGDISLEVAKDRMYLVDWRLAKRQMTWFRRHKFIEWMSSDDIHEFVQAKVKEL